jgi:hypothetical protein
VESHSPLTLFDLWRRYFIKKAMDVLEYGCGNLYINDKPTGT